LPFSDIFQGYDFSRLNGYDFFRLPQVRNYQTLHPN
jgi:hypothetical protein